MLATPIGTFDPTRSRIELPTVVSNVNGKLLTRLSPWCRESDSSMRTGTRPDSARDSDASAGAAGFAVVAGAWGVGTGCCAMVDVVATTPPAHRQIRTR